MNAGRSRITTPQAREDLAHLNLRAGQKAKAATAYGAAVDFLAIGIALLPPQAWTHHYDLTLALYTEAADAAYLSTDFEQMEQWANHAIQQARTLLDTIPVQQTRLMGAKAQGQLQQALQIGLQVLQSLGVDLPTQPTQADVAAAFGATRQLWQDTAPLSLLELPPMTDPHRLATLQILSWLVPCAYWGNPTLMALLIFKQVELSLQDGNCPLSIYGYVDYGLILCGVIGDIPSGYDFGQLALKLLDQLQDPSFKCRAWYVTYTYIQHWKAPLQESIPPLQEAFQTGLETGDQECAGLNAAAYCGYAYHAGQELTGLADAIAAYRQTVCRLKQKTSQYYLEIYEQTILNLLGQTPAPEQLTGAVFNAATAEPLLQATHHRTALFYLHFNQMVLSYLFGHYPQAAHAAILAEHYLDGGIGTFMVPLYAFYDALIQLALCDSTVETQQDGLDRVDRHQERLKNWATLAPFNHQHRWELVEAERYRVAGQRSEAIEYYDRAIASALKNGFIQDEALANERAAQFYLDWGKETLAVGYMQAADHRYTQWGAKAKTDDLANRYPELLSSKILSAVSARNSLEVLASSAVHHLSIHGSTPSSHSSSVSLNSTLDFASVLKASQSLSGTIQLDQLLHQLTQIILHNSGGDRCALILPDPTGEWRIEAIATPEAVELYSAPLAGSPQVPVKLIQYVKNTQVAMAVDHFKVGVSISAEYLRDEYLVQRRPKSILCLPILNQGKLLGILYLESCSTSGVFTKDRLLILNFLCTQAAISLENARLYQQFQQYAQDLERSEATNRALIAAIPDLLIRVNREGIYLDIAGSDHLNVQQTDVFFPGASVYDSLPLDKAEERMQAIQRSLETGITQIYEQQFVTPDRVQYEEVRIAVCDQDEALIIVRDISDRKYAEATILKKSQELEQALSDLQNTQLQMVQNEKMASLGNLVAGIAHEINNPIGFLTGSINNAKDYVHDLLSHLALYQQYAPQVATPVQEHAEEIDLEFLCEDLPKLLTSMKGATDRIKGISTSLRTFSRADTDHKVSANLHEGLDSTLLILKYRIKANQYRPAIQVISNYGELPLIQCFPGQLNQVFMNVLANAIDVFDEAAQQLSFAALEAHPQIITLHTSVIPEPYTVEIRIHDNGRGMSEAVKAKIFDHLFTTKGVGKGTGLGLAIARQIVVEKHQGSIEVQSALGHGTEFCIRLPILS